MFQSEVTGRSETVALNITEIRAVRKALQPNFMDVCVSQSHDVDSRSDLSLALNHEALAACVRRSGCQLPGYSTCVVRHDAETTSASKSRRYHDCQYESSPQPH